MEVSECEFDEVKASELSKTSDNKVSIYKDDPEYKNDVTFQSLFTYVIFKLFSIRI